MTDYESLSDRELDAAVHKDVMGIIWDFYRCPVCGWPFAGTREQGCVVDDCSMRPVPAKRADEPAHYSTGWLAASTVVEKMREINRFKPAFFEMAMLPTGWRANFVGDPRYYAYSPTAPRAICAAALKALEATT